MSKVFENEAADENEEIVEAIKRSYITQLFVEFLQFGGPKPHVVLRLNVHPEIDFGDNTYLGCRLAMDLVGGLEGEFNLSPLPYSSTSHAAHTAFEFSLKNLSWTVNDVLACINDLLDFSFAGGFTVPGQTTEYVDGCRDFISQVFIILHKAGLVSWHICKVDRGVFHTTNLAIRLGRTGFHEIIGYNYHKPTGRSNSTVVAPLPLARGTFHEPSFRRVLEYRVDERRRYQLPYHPVNVQEGDEGYDTVGQASHGSISYAGTRNEEWSSWSWREEYKCYERYRYGPDGGVIYDYSAPQN